MVVIPNTKLSVLVRTDFSSDDAWQAVCEAVSTPKPEFMQFVDYFKRTRPDFDEASLEFVQCLDDPQFDSVATEELLVELPSEYPHSCLYVFDRLTAAGAEYPILVVDLTWERGRTFRTVPAEIQSIESNLSIANMDWEDFAESVDEDSVFRGFPDPTG